MSFLLVSLCFVGALIVGSAHAQTAKTVAPAEGATLTGNWAEWNLLANRPGNTYGNIDNKIRTAWYNYMGLGSNTNAQDVRFVPGKPNEAFCGTGPTQFQGQSCWQANTEGQGYAMMFAAEFGDGTGSTDDMAAHRMFDALARYVTNELQWWHGNPPAYWYSDYETFVRQSDGFVYHPNVQNTFNGVSNAAYPGPAPDGECWMAQAFFIASGKWGNTGADGNPIQLQAFTSLPGITHAGTGNTAATTDYVGMANLMLGTYIHMEDWEARDGFDGSQYALLNMFDVNHNQAWNPSPGTYLPGFVPDNYVRGGTTVNDYLFTDPSYNLPAFTEYWAKYAKSDNATWTTVASKERALIHANVSKSATGLPSCYCTTAGVAYQSNDGNQGLLYGGDSERVPATNITLDWMWWGDPINNPTDFGWQNTWANTFYQGMWNRSTKTFGNQPNTKSQYGALSYSGAMLQDGSNDVYNGQQITTHLEGTGAQNGVGIDLVNNQAQAWYFVDELADMPQPDGVVTWGSAYWDGSLYLIALMEAATKFRPTPPYGAILNEFTASNAVITPSSNVITSTPVTISSTFTNISGASITGKLTLQLLNGSTVIGSYNDSAVTLANNAAKSETLSLNAPSTPGVYSITALATNTAGTTNYLTKTIGTLTVVASGPPPTFTVSSSYAPSTTVAPGGVITVTSVFTDTGGTLTNGQLGFYLYNSNNVLVSQFASTGVSLSHGGKSTVTWAITMPNSAGTYSLYAEAWNSNRSANYLNLLTSSLKTVARTAADGVYTITNSLSGFAIDTKGAVAERSALQQYTVKPLTSEDWLVKYSNGFYTIQNLASGLYITDSKIGSSSSTLQQRSSDGGNDQLWSFTPSGTGYVIQNALDSNAIDCAGWVTSGSVLVTATPTSTAGQLWKLTSVTASSVPNAPTNLVGQSTQIGTGQIHLTWQPSAGATDYGVYRNFVLIRTTSSSSFTDKVLAIGSTNYYFVTAMNAAGQSGLSNVITVVAN